MVEVIYKERIRNGTMKQKNVYIQVMRFLFSLCIILFHMRGIKELDEKHYLTGGGYIGVEFFGIVSGFLMCSGVNVLVDDTIKASKKYLITINEQI